MSSKQPKNEMQPTWQFDQATVLFTVINGEIVIKTFGDSDALVFAEYVSQFANVVIENKDSISKFLEQIGKK